jgi:poly-gamma-glutamate capsule biosynthesis protein CapA/YwtB (metallophosphatase superfamily)
MRIASLLVMCGALAVAACQTPTPHRNPEEEYGRLHTIAFGGDTVLARRENWFVEQNGPAKALGGVRQVLSGADLAIVNLETSVAAGGEPIDKGERNPYFYRARPEMIRVLTEVGVDVASFANNHAGDYGPEAVNEGVRLLRESGIDPVGAGANVDDAMAPVFRKVGDTVVAFIAMDMTQRKVGATASRAGTHFVWEGDPDAVVARVQEQVRLARRYAHLVFFACHWGFNYDEEPSDAHRELAGRLIRDAGVDAILGSSAHQMQGLEAIDGHPVIYDAGNLLFDYGDDAWTHKTAVFVLHFDRVGVRWVEVVPVRMHNSYSELAQGDERTEIARRVEDLSRRLGAKLWIEDGRAMLGLWDVRPREAPRETYRPPAPRKLSITTATSYRPPHATVPAVPATATPFDVQLEGGLSLVGAEVPRTAKRREAVRLVTYWRAAKQQTDSYQIFTHVEPQAGEHRPRWNGDHQPGDWSYPTTRWVPGEIVVDAHYIRPPNDSAAGPHDVYVGLFDERHRVKVLDAARHDGEHRIKIGTIQIE